VFRAAPGAYFLLLCTCAGFAAGLQQSLDLDPSLVHRLEPLSLLLGILVRDCADGVVPPTILVDLARVPLVALINWTYLDLEPDKLI
jgi:hypothetical protein